MGCTPKYRKVLKAVKKQGTANNPYAVAHSVTANPHNSPNPDNPLLPFAFAIVGLILFLNFRAKKDLRARNVM
jgi:hypothetical protein